MSARKRTRTTAHPDGRGERFQVRRRRLRDLVAERDGRLLLAIGVGSGAEARMLHHVVCDLYEARAVPDYVSGFVTFVSGYLCAAAHGLPDLGFVLRSEMAAQTDVVEQATWLAALDRRSDAWPIGVDIDTGYGSEPAAVLLSCRQVHKQGASYVQIEDQLAINKSCGHMDGPRGLGKSVVDADEMIERRLAPALAYAADQDDLLVAARTDALAMHGIDEALARATRYVEAGAQLVFVEAPESDADLRRIARAMSGSGALNVANMVEGSTKTPYKTPRQLHALGFDVGLYPVGAFLAGGRSQLDYFRAVARGRKPDGDGDGSDFFERFHRVIGRAQVESWNRPERSPRSSDAPAERKRRRKASDEDRR